MRQPPAHSPGRQTAQADGKTAIPFVSHRQIDRHRNLPANNKRHFTTHRIRHDYFLSNSYPFFFKPSHKYLFQVSLVQPVHCMVPASLRSGYCMYRMYKVFLCFLCGSQNKQRLFPYTALTDWFLYPRRSVFTARYGLGLPLKPSGYFMYRQV
jgi:hypothetical protein